MAASKGRAPTPKRNNPPGPDTGARVASLASNQLRNPKSTPAQKSVAAAALANKRPAPASKGAARKGK